MLLAASLLGALLARSPVLRAQCLDAEATTARTRSIAASNDAAVAAALASIDRGRGLTAIPVEPRMIELPTPPVLISERPTRARIERRRGGANGVWRLVLVAPAYVYNPCVESNVAPDAFRVARTPRGRWVLLRVVFTDRTEAVPSCQCIGGCGAAIPPRRVVREYEIPAASARDVGPIETVRVPRVVVRQLVCTGMG